MKQKVKDKNPRIALIGKTILVSVAVVGIVSVAVLFPGVAHIIAPFVRKKKYSPKQAIERNLESLIRSGLLKKTFDSNGDAHVELTKKGKWEAFIRGNSRDTLKQKWDGMWRMVIFDVPLSKNTLRRELRRAMSLYGFVMIQKSVWAYPHACDDFIELIKSHLGIANDVLYMKVLYLENDASLRKEFKI